MDIISVQTDPFVYTLHAQTEMYLFQMDPFKRMQTEAHICIICEL